MAKGGNDNRNIGVLAEIVSYKAGGFYQLISHGVNGNAQLICYFLVRAALYFAHSENQLTLGR